MKEKKTNFRVSIIFIILCILFSYKIHNIKQKNESLQNTNSILSSENEEMIITYDNLNNDYCNLQREYNNLSQNYDLIITKNEQLQKDCLSYIEPFKQTNPQDYLEQYKIITNESMYNYYSENEIFYMCKCIETETYQCDLESKINVANVIINRIKDNRFPNDAISVITDNNQFAYERSNISESTKIALEYAILFEDTTGGSIGFRSDCSPSSWNGWSYVFTDDVGHSFYK